VKTGNGFTVPAGSRERSREPTKPSHPAEWASVSSHTTVGSADGLGSADADPGTGRNLPTTHATARWHGSAQGPPRGARLARIGQVGP
jgi:hypothetical protein